MTVVLLDPRFPAMIPVEAIRMLEGDVSFTEEVPIRVRWVIADLGGHTVLDSEVLVTTDVSNELVVERLEDGDTLVKAPSLLVELEGDRELLAAPAAEGALSEPADGAAAAPLVAVEEISHSGAAVVDGEILATDDHTAVVAGLRRTTRTEVPASVMDELEDAIAVMARALRQGEWERQQNHSSLVQFLQEETLELARIAAVVDRYGKGGKPAAMKPAWVEQELCEELGDVLLQVLFHAQLANMRGAFDIGHVAGALVVKLRERAPYLFEEVEREVTVEEQDRLWEEAKRRSRQARLAKFGETYAAFLEEPVGSSVGADAAGEAPAGANLGADPQPVSGIAAAEAVIRKARALGLADGEIPTDIRYPMVGLELDEPGQAEQRLLDAVQAFALVLAARAAEQQR